MMLKVLTLVESNHLKVPSPDGNTPPMKQLLLSLYNFETGCNEVDNGWMTYGPSRRLCESMFKTKHFDFNESLTSTLPDARSMITGKTQGKTVRMAVKITHCPKIFHPIHHQSQRIFRTQL
jgi:hypothetical protein